MQLLPSGLLKCGWSFLPSDIKEFTFSEKYCVSTQLENVFQRKGTFACKRVKQIFPDQENFAKVIKKQWKFSNKTRQEFLAYLKQMLNSVKKSLKNVFFSKKYFLAKTFNANLNDYKYKGTYSLASKKLKEKNNLYTCLMKFNHRFSNSKTRHIDIGCQGSDKCLHFQYFDC